MKDSATHLILVMGAVVLFGILLAILAKGGYLNGHYLRQVASDTVNYEQFNK